MRQVQSLGGDAAEVAEIVVPSREAGCMATLLMRSLCAG